MTSPNAETPYTLRSIQEMLGLTRGVILSLINAGFVGPTRGERNEYRFSFQDVVLLRTAHNLQAANISPRKILRSLQRLKAALPKELPLTGLRITALGNHIAVRSGDTQWEAESGQLLMDFEVAPARGMVAFMQHRSRLHGALQSGPGKFGAPQSESRQPEPALDNAGEWFARGEELEEAQATAEAEVAYRRALTIAPKYSDAWLNLGALMCEASRCDDAVLLYDEALKHCPDEALLHFNRAIALEDLGRTQEAIKDYEACLKLAPELADAHYNAARLHEKQGNTQKAVRHLSTYRRLER